MTAFASDTKPIQKPYNLMICYDSYTKNMNKKESDANKLIIPAERDIEQERIYSKMSAALRKKYIRSNLCGHMYSYRCFQDGWNISLSKAEICFIEYTMNLPIRFVQMIMSNRCSFVDVNKLSNQEKEMVQVNIKIPLLIKVADNTTHIRNKNILNESLNEYDLSSNVPYEIEREINRNVQRVINIESFNAQTSNKTCSNTDEISDDEDIEWECVWKSDHILDSDDDNESDDDMDEKSIQWMLLGETDVHLRHRNIANFVIHGSVLCFRSNTYNLDIPLGRMSVKLTK